MYIFQMKYCKYQTEYGLTRNSSVMRQKCRGLTSLSDLAAFKRQDEEVYWRETTIKVCHTIVLTLSDDSKKHEQWTTI